MTALTANAAERTLAAGEFSHAGERAVQARAGRAFRGHIRDNVPAIAAAFLLTQQVIVIAGRAADGRMWTTMVAGSRGFLRVPDPRTVYIHALPTPADPLADLVAAGGPIGMIAVDAHHRMRVNGMLTPRPDGFAVHTEQVYANCVKYISERHPLPRDADDTDPVVTRAAALDPAQIAQVRTADMFFIGTHHPGGPADASHRGGRPGFVLVDAPDRLCWLDYVGNSMFNTLGNLALDARAGLLFPDWATGGLLQVSGRAWVNWDAAASEPLPGAQRVVEFAIDGVRHIANATGLRWTSPILSRFNP